MSIKKKILVIYSCVLFTTLIVGSFYYFFKEVNVMNEIYTANKRMDLKAFNKVPEIKGVSYEDLSDYENFGGLSIPYKQEFLRSDCESELFFPAIGGKVMIKSNVRLDACTLLIIHMSYDYKNKVMIMEPIHISYRKEDQELGEHYYDSQTITEFLNRFHLEEKDIREYQDYFLYDVVVKTWAKAHGGNADKAVQKMKECIKIDKTFTFDN